MKKALVMFLAIIAIATTMFWCAAIDKIGYRSDLGFYDKNTRSWNVGEYALYGEDAIIYPNAHLNVIEILKEVLD